MTPRKAAFGRLKSIVRRFGRKRILVLGDLMLDEFIRGKVRRLSPEAPVPVVEVLSESQMPGGAGNVCSNLAALGASVSIRSIIGRDAAGQRLRAILLERGVDTEGILLDPERPTTQKCRVVADHQQVVRYDREKSAPTDPRSQNALMRGLSSDSSRFDAIIISDYGKGVVTVPLLRNAIRAARKAGIPITVDPKIEHFKRYLGVDCITPNLHEAWSGMGLVPKEGAAAIEDLGLRILRTLRTASLLITRGEHGMSLFENGSRARVTHIPAEAQEVFDVTGAGDTVISVFTLALACGASRLDAAVLANLAAGIVVGKLGTATITAKELEGALR